MNVFRSPVSVAAYNSPLVITALTTRSVEFRCEAAMPREGSSSFNPMDASGIIASNQAPEPDDRDANSRARSDVYSNENCAGFIVDVHSPEKKKKLHSFNSNTIDQI